uniref:Reverse transcriptase domain-containing protein n=1 Tax=Trichuris muris TaxID=70415 RepID=A0A5S6Q2W4_TRIMR
MESLPAQIRPNWDKDEQDALVNAEVELASSGSLPATRCNVALRQYLMSNFGIDRTKEAIRTQRKRAPHKAAVQAALSRRHSMPNLHVFLPTDTLALQSHAACCEELSWPSKDAVAAILGDPSPHQHDSEFCDLIRTTLLLHENPHPADILHATYNFLTARFASIPPARRRFRHGRLTPGRGRARFIRLQHLFHKDRQALLRAITGEAPALDNSLNIKDITNTLRSRFSKPSAPDNAPFSCKSSPTPSPIVPPISVPEILLAQRNLPGSSAPGPDEVTAPVAKTIPPQLLCKIFNISLFLRNVPRDYKTSRTVILPKNSQQPSSNDFRPITINSNIYRIFSKIINARLLPQVSLNRCQAGFQKDLDGCSENIRLLLACINNARQTNSSIGVAFLDVAKAFDTVSHHSVARALQHHDVHPYLSELILNMLRGGSTVIEFKGQTSQPVCISNGVKQGDPISPLLFNLVIDELLDQLEEANRCYSWKQTGRPESSNAMEPQLSVLAFADDIAVVARSRTALNQQLMVCSTFFEQRNLRLNPNKCSVLLLVPRRRAVSSRVPLREQSVFLRLGATLHPLPLLRPDSFYKYLGRVPALTAVARAAPTHFQVRRAVQDDPLRRQWQAGSLTGAVHLLNGNAGVPSTNRDRESVAYRSF